MVVMVVVVIVIVVVIVFDRGRRQLPPVGPREPLSAHEKGSVGQLINHYGTPGMGGRGWPGKHYFGKFFDKMCSEKLCSGTDT